MVGSGEVKYKDNHYDYINIDAVSLLTILVSAPCTFSLYRGNIFHPSIDLRFQFPHDYIANEIDSIIIWRVSIIMLHHNLIDRSTKIKINFRY